MIWGILQYSQIWQAGQAGKSPISMVKFHEVLRFILGSKVNDLNGAETMGNWCSCYPRTSPKAPRIFPPSHFLHARSDAQPQAQKGNLGAGMAKTWYYDVPSGNDIAMENCLFLVNFPIKIVIFHSYVSLPGDTMVRQSTHSSLRWYPRYRRYDD